jgi:hypothetical protein
MEWAGAFGDVGTLIPFVVAYIYGLSRSMAVENLNFNIRDRTGIPYIPSTIIEQPGPVAAAPLQSCRLPLK